MHSSTSDIRGKNITFTKWVKKKKQKKKNTFDHTLSRISDKPGNWLGKGHPFSYSLIYKGTQVLFEIRLLKKKLACGNPKSNKFNEIFAIGCYWAKFVKFHWHLTWWSRKAWVSKDRWIQKLLHLFCLHFEGFLGVQCGKVRTLLSLSIFAERTPCSLKSWPEYGQC